MFSPKRATIVALALVGMYVPATSAARAGNAAPRRQATIPASHVRAYNQAYHAVASKFGHRAPGRQILRWGFAPGRPATDAEVVASLAVLQRMLAPPPAPPTPTSGSSVGTGGSTASSSNLETCVIQHESGGNPNAVSGQYRGIGQWSPYAWAQDGGTQYASSPTGASYAQQKAVLDGEGDKGMRQQQGQYDGCS